MVKKGRPKAGKSELELQAIKDALMKYRGRVYAAARALKVSAVSLYKWIEDYNELREYLTEVYETTLDECELRVIKMGSEGSLKANMLYLNVYGKGRGWGRQQQANNIALNSSGNNVNLYLPDNGRANVE